MVGDVSDRAAAVVSHPWRTECHRSESNLSHFVRGLDDDVRERLRVRAARNGRSMEAEIRDILTTAVSDAESSADLFSTLLERFSGAEGVELPIPSRTSPARAADLSE